MIVMIILQGEELVTDTADNSYDNTEELDSRFDQAKQNPARCLMVRRIRAMAIQASLEGLRHPEKPLAANGLSPRHAGLRPVGEPHGITTN